MPLSLAIDFFPPSGNGLVDKLPYLGVALIAIALFFILRSRRRKAGGPPVTAREQIDRYKQDRGVRNDLESLMVEIEQLAKRMGAQLDAKSVQLERLIRDADDRLARLERARTEAPVPPVAPAPAPLPSLPPSTPAPAGVPTDPLARSVHELADQGLPPVEIARKLQEHVGKVELILALRRA